MQAFGKPLSSFFNIRHPIYLSVADPLQVEPDNNLSAGSVSFGRCKVTSEECLSVFQACKPDIAVSMSVRQSIDASIKRRLRAVDRTLEFADQAIAASHRVQPLASSCQSWEGVQSRGNDVPL